MVEYAAGTAEKASNSIVGHRHFPAVAALWFAALLGLGSLAIRPALIESAVLSMRLDTLIAAAAPPLGMTARLLLALAMGGFGAVVGLILARKIAAPRDTGMRLRARDAHPDAPARRPLSAATDLAEDRGASSDIAGPVLGQRRRTLAISEDDYPMEIVDFAPLPGADRPFSPSAIADPSGPDEIAETAPMLLALDDLALDDSDIVDDHDYSAIDETVATLVEAEPALASASGPAGPFAPAATTSSAAAMAHFPLGSLSLAELSTRLSAALAGRRSRLAASTAMALSELVAAQAPAATSSLAPTVITDPASEAPLQLPTMLAQPAPAAAFEDEAEADHAPSVPRLFGTLPAALRPIAAAYDDDEVDLADDRFALPPRGLWAAGDPVRMTFPAPPADQAKIAAADSAADRPSELAEPISDEASEPALAELGDLDSAAGDSESDDIENDGPQDDSYSSLLDISVSALSRPGHVRIEDQPAAVDAIEPAVVFPGQLPRFAASAAAPREDAGPAPATGLRRFDPAGAAPRGSGFAGSNPVQTSGDSEATERALRAALATLQRMSGAA